MRRMIIPLAGVAVAVAVLALLIPGGVSGQDGGLAPTSNAGGVAFFCSNGVVDLKWDPALLESPPGTQFARVELLRGPDLGSLSLLTVIPSQTTEFFRDESVMVDTLYYYRLIQVRSEIAPPNLEHRYTEFTSSADTNYCRGTLHQDWTMGPAQGGYDLSGSITVDDNASLTISDADLNPALGYPDLRVLRGSLRLDDVRLHWPQGRSPIDIYFGPQSSGWVRDCDIEAGDIQIEAANVEVSGNTAGTRYVYVDYVSNGTGVVRNNFGIRTVSARGSSEVTVEDERLWVVSVHDDGEMTVRNNSVISHVVYMDGGDLEITGCEITPGGGETGDLRIEGDGHLVLKRNEINKTVLNFEQNATVEITDNIFENSRFGIWDAAGGLINQNSIQNGYGLWVGGGQDRPGLVIRHNCVQGNDPGLRVYDYRPTALDVSDNYWGDPSGPAPWGLGDEVIGQVITSPVDIEPIYCKDQFPEIKGQVYVPGSTYPLMQVPVALVRNGQVLGRAVTEKYGGTFVMSRVPITDNLVISVTLECAAARPSIFRVLYETLAGPVASASTNPFRTTGPGTVNMQIQFADAPGINTALPRDRLDDLGMIYYHTHQAWLLLDEVLSQRLDYNLPLDVVAFSTVADVFWEGDMSSAPGVVPDPFINIEDANGASEITDGGRPDNREWHEFGHHTQADTSGNLMPDDPTVGNTNHGGYYNVSTNDSYTEGFAEFLSMMVAWHIDADPRPELYRLGGHDGNLESNYLSWSQPEEFAVAGLLLDLVDPADARDVTIMGDTTYADCVEMRLEDLWGIIETDWGDVHQSPVAAGQGFGYLFDVKQLYDLLKMQGVGSAYSRGRGFDDLDELFIAHGFFSDVHVPYRIFNQGEEIGVTGYMTVTRPDGSMVPARPIRRSLPPIPGSYIRVDGESAETGAAVGLEEFLVDVEFAAPVEHYSYSYMNYGSSSTPRRIYYHGPDPKYSAVTSVIARGSRHISTEPLTFTNWLYWDRLSLQPTDSFLEHTFNMAPALEVYLPVVLRGSRGDLAAYAATVLEPGKAWPSNGAQACIPDNPPPPPTPGVKPTAPIVESIEPSSVVVGYADTQVTVYGHFFEVGASPYVGHALLQNVVYMGLEPSPPHRWRLKATLPSGLAQGIYDVTVINPNGRSGILADAFTITGSSAQAHTATEIVGAGAARKRTPTPTTSTSTAVLGSVVRP